jgi:hypothetical protein
MNTPFSSVSSHTRRQYDPDYWSQRFSSEPYLEEADRFEDFEPAYRFGHSLHGEIDDMELREADWAERWNRVKGECRLSWHRAKHAIRAAWREAEAGVGVSVSRCEAKIAAAVHRFEDKVRQQPGEYVLGAAATGFVAAHLPLRSLVLTGIGMAAAAAPAALVVFGLWKAADHFFGAEATQRNRYVP